MPDCVQSRLPEGCQICFQIVFIRPVLADVVILTVGAVPGDARQKVEEQKLKIRERTRKGRDERDKAGGEF